MEIRGQAMRRFKRTLASDMPCYCVSALAGTGKTSRRLASASAGRAQEGPRARSSNRPKKLLLVAVKVANEAYAQSTPN